MPIVLFGTDYWDEVVNFTALVKYGTISPHDLDIFHRTDSTQASRKTHHGGNR
jgi:predicted Rossmann-fold nucleotide-binding protein